MARQGKARQGKARQGKAYRTYAGEQRRTISPPTSNSNSTTINPLFGFFL
jgi:hypothetical protein